jgi:hypothetical protein
VTALAPQISALNIQQTLRLSPSAAPQDENAAPKLPANLFEKLIAGLVEEAQPEGAVLRGGKDVAPGSTRAMLPGSPESNVQSAPASGAQGGVAQSLRAVLPQASSASDALDVEGSRPAMQPALTGEADADTSGGEAVITEHPVFSPLTHSDRSPIAEAAYSRHSAPDVSFLAVAPNSGVGATAQPAVKFKAPPAPADSESDDGDGAAGGRSAPDAFQGAIANAPPASKKDVPHPQSKTELAKNPSLPEAACLDNAEAASSWHPQAYEYTALLPPKGDPACASAFPRKPQIRGGPGGPAQPSAGCPLARVMVAEEPVTEKATAPTAPEGTREKISSPEPPVEVHQSPVPLVASPRLQVSSWEPQAAFQVSANQPETFVGGPGGPSHLETAKGKTTQPSPPVAPQTFSIGDILARNASTPPSAPARPEAMAAAPARAGVRFGVESAKLQMAWLPESEKEQLLPPAEARTAATPGSYTDDHLRDPGRVPVVSQHGALNPAAAAWLSRAEASQPPLPVGMQRDASSRVSRAEISAHTAVRMQESALPLADAGSGRTFSSPSQMEATDAAPPPIPTSRFPLSGGNFKTAMPGWRLPDTAQPPAAETHVVDAFQAPQEIRAEAGMPMATKDRMLPFQERLQPKESRTRWSPRVPGVSPKTAGEGQPSLSTPASAAANPAPVSPVPTTPAVDGFIAPRIRALPSASRQADPLNVPASLQERLAALETNTFSWPDSLRGTPADFPPNVANASDLPDRSILPSSSEAEITPVVASVAALEPDLVFRAQLTPLAAASGPTPLDFPNSRPPGHEATTFFRPAVAESPAENPVPADGDTSNSSVFTANAPSPLTAPAAAPERNMDALLWWRPVVETGRHPGSLLLDDDARAAQIPEDAEEPTAAELPGARRSALWGQAPGTENASAAPERHGQSAAATTPEPPGAHQFSGPEFPNLPVPTKASAEAPAHPGALSSAPQQTPAEAARAASAEPLAPTQPRNSGPVQDIQLRLSLADRQVDVRVSGRGGDVRVDVHSPDTRLAGDLRENLPELAARMEQTGYRAEISQPLSQPAPDRWRFAQAGGSQPDSDGRRQGGQNQQENRRDDSRDDPRPAKGTSDRKDFRWLYNSIRHD